MINKNLLIFGLVLLMLSSFVSATISTNPADYVLYEEGNTTSNSVTYFNLSSTADKFFCNLTFTTTGSANNPNIQFYESNNTPIIGFQNRHSAGIHTHRKIVLTTFTDLGNVNALDYLKATVSFQINKSADWSYIKTYDRNDTFKYQSTLTTPTISGVYKIGFTDGTTSLKTYNLYCWNGTETDRPIVTSNFTITAKDIYDDSSLTDFEVYVRGFNERVNFNYTDYVNVSGLTNWNNAFDNDMSTFAELSGLSVSPKCIEYIFNYTNDNYIEQEQIVWSFKAQAINNINDIATGTLTSTGVTGNCYNQKDLKFKTCLTYVTTPTTISGWSVSCFNGTVFTSVSSGATIGAGELNDIYDFNLSYTKKTQSYNDSGTGTITTDILSTDTDKYNITFVKSDYANRTYTDYNISLSGDLEGVLTFYFKINETTYNSEVITTTQQTITQIINKTSEVTDIVAYLVYDGTTYTPSETDSGNYTTFSVSFYTPYYAVDTNVSFNWSYTIVRASGNTTGTTTTYNQTIYTIEIDNCSTYTTRAINITTYDEESLATLNTTINGHFTVWDELSNTTKSFNLSWSGNYNYGICINPSYANYTFNAQLEYEATDYETKTYYFNSASLTNVSYDLSLYLSNLTTVVTFTVIDQDDNPVANVFISVLKYFFGTDSSETVEIIKTNSNGQALGQIVLDTTWYVFILTLNGETIQETEPVKITSTTKTFRINTGEAILEDYNTVLGSTCLLTFDETTDTYEYVFSDPTGEVALGCLRVIRRSVSGDVRVYNSCTASSSGTLSYTVNSTGDYTYIGYGFLSTDALSDEYYPCGEPVSYSYDNGWQTYQDEGLFLSIGILLTLSLAVIRFAGLVGSVLFMAVGIFLLQIIGFLHLETQVLWVIGLSAALIIWRLKKI